MLEALTRPAPTPVVNHTFLDAVFEGLSQPQKTLPPKYFYDTRGSHYFDQICELEEYYLYRSELKLLPQAAAELKNYVEGETAVIEFGGGALKKIQPLLNALPSVCAYLPIDIAGEYLAMSCKALRAQFPQLRIHPVEADFCQSVELPDLEADSRLGFFPGSTIGNFTPLEVKRFLTTAGQTLGEDSWFLVGVDTKKSPGILHRAYNDSHQVTAEFNRNVLRRINEELLGDFDLEQFEHYAFYNASEGCIEMHLVSVANQEVNIAGQKFYFETGESIHTESSYKYNPEEFRALAMSAGWRTEKTWLGKNGIFSIHLLRRGRG